MKYTINGFYQAEMMALKLDCIDAVILEYIVDLSVGIKIYKTENENGDTYFWVKYDKLLENLPILKIKKQALSDRLKKYVSKRILNQWIKKDRDGTFSLYSFNFDVYSKLKYDKNNAL